MKSVILDTNCFLRLILYDLPSQADQVKDLIKKAKKEQIQILVPQIILFEIDYILQKYYLFRKEEIIERLKSLVSSSYFTIESKETFRIALFLYEKENISLVDCFLLSKAKEENADLFTFDKKLKNLT